jgi:hypothetical protein
MGQCPGPGNFRGLCKVISLILQNPEKFKKSIINTTTRAGAAAPALGFVVPENENEKMRT